MPQSKASQPLQTPPGMDSFLHPGRPGHGAGRNMPVIKPKDFRGSFVRLWDYFRKEKRLLAVILLLVLGDAAVSLSAPFLIGRAVDTMQGAGQVTLSLLGVIVTVMLIAYITDTFITFLQNYLMAGVSQRIVKRLRRHLFEKLQKLPISFFDQNLHGDLMSRLTNDIDNISTTFSQNIVSLMTDVIGVLGSLTLMFILSPLLTLAAMITIPLVLVLSKIITKRTHVLFKRQQTVLGSLNGQIEESISGLRIIRTFNHEEIMTEEFDKTNEDLCKVGINAQIWSGFLMPLMNVISNLGFAVIACIGGIMAVQGSVTVGVIASFLSYSKQFSRPLNDIANIFNSLQTAIAGAERIFEILDENEELPDAPAASEMKAPRGEVEFRNVTFGYDKKTVVLNNISFTVKAGSTVALVGPTGAGKTTLVNLINRFYDVDEGEILIDGKDINDYTRSSLRKNFGIVLQDTYLFSGSIRENISYGNPDASEKQIRDAAVMSNADHFISKLSAGYDTQLTESGSNLSEGERQLLAIARAILADPAILILDEATSSVDTRTEMQIQKAMIELMKGRTCFIIAHRLSTIRDADRIMVIDNGKIIESGSHKQLLEKKGFYYELCSSQYKNEMV
ncbi:MAG: ABC transporter ATP-binding protein [Eubacteriales bacterium]